MVYNTVTSRLEKTLCWLVPSALVYKMNVADAAYLAGIIDGEGTITITRQTQYKRKTFAYRTRLSVGNTSIDLINVLKERHGGNSGLFRKAKENRKAFYYWRVLAQEKIEHILRYVPPFLLIKRKQADLMLRFLESRFEQTSRKLYTPEEHEIAKEIRKLNRRSLTQPV